MRQLRACGDEMILNKRYLFIKRIIDLFFAIILLLIIFPIMIICAILIKIEDPNGPVLFIQERIGRGNRIFKVFKFRSMKVKKEINGNKLTDSQRMLKVGNILRKLSIDELPQLLNIVRGEMSFIGPRPLPVIYLPYYTNEELHRHDINPGLSGWAQVNGRNYIGWDDRFEYDLEYVNNISFKFDLKIFILTVKKVFLGSDVGVRGVDFEDKSLHKIREKNKNLNL